MQYMKKAELYNVDTNRVATAKQVYAVARHFAKIQSKTAAEAYKLTKVFGAIMMKFNAEHSATPITHGDIAKFFELEKVPAKFVEQITTKAPKARKASPKPKASAKEKAKPKASTAPKASTQSVEDFKARLEAIDARFNKVEATVESHGKKLASMDAKLDILMAWLETNPEL